MKKIKELISNVISPSLDVKYIHDVAGVSTTETLITTAQAKLYLLNKYGNYIAYNADSKEDFLALWGLHNDLNGFGLFQMLQGLQSEYNPLVNVDFTETTTLQADDRKHTEDIDDRENKIGEVDITLNKDGVTNTSTSKQYPFNSVDTAIDIGIEEQTLGEVINHNDEQTNVVGGGTDVYTDDAYTDITTREKKGNDGATMTTQRLIEEERRVRETRNVIYTYLDDFVKEYCYMIRGV